MRAKKIVSGGQTGVDRGALDACLEKHFNCGGWCPKDRRAEDGRIAGKYPLKETKQFGYYTRTRLNVENSDGTLIISPGKLFGGTLHTWKICKELNKPVLIVAPDLEKIKTFTDKIADWINAHNIRILNVAGPRKSEWKQGYQMSCLLIRNLITDMEEPAPG